MFSIFKPYIFSLDPEVAHDLAIQSLKFNVLPKSIFNVKDEDILEQQMDSIMSIPRVEDNSEKIEALQRQLDSLKALSNN